MASTTRAKSLLDANDVDAPKPADLGGSETTTAPTTVGSSVVVSPSIALIDKPIPFTSLFGTSAEGMTIELSTTKPTAIPFPRGFIIHLLHPTTLEPLPSLALRVHEKVEGLGLYTYEARWVIKDEEGSWIEVVKQVPVGLRARSTPQPDRWTGKISPDPMQLEYINGTKVFNEINQYEKGGGVRFLAFESGATVKGEVGVNQKIGIVVDGVSQEPGMMFGMNMSVVVFALHEPLESVLQRCTPKETVSLLKECWSHLRLLNDIDVHIVEFGAHAFVVERVWDKGATKYKTGKKVWASSFSSVFVPGMTSAINPEDIEWGFSPCLSPMMFFLTVRKALSKSLEERIDVKTGVQVIRPLHQQWTAEKIRETAMMFHKFSNGGPSLESAGFSLALMFVNAILERNNSNQIVIPYNTVEDVRSIFLGQPNSGASAIGLPLDDSHRRIDELWSFFVRVWEDKEWKSGLGEWKVFENVFDALLAKPDPRAGLLESVPLSQLLDPEYENRVVGPLIKELEKSFKGKKLVANANLGPKKDDGSAGFVDSTGGLHPPHHASRKVSSLPPSSCTRSKQTSDSASTVKEMEMETADPSV